MTDSTTTDLTTIQIPADLRNQLKAAAALKGKTLTEFATAILSSSLEVKPDA